MEQSSDKVLENALANGGESRTNTHTHTHTHIHAESVNYIV